MAGLLGLVMAGGVGCTDANEGAESSVDKGPAVVESSLSTEVVDETVSAYALSLADLAVGSDGRLYVAGPAGIVQRTPAGTWRGLDLAQLPAGDAAPWPPDWPPGWPGRDVALVEVGPDGELWAAGVSFSRADDDRFGGEFNPYFGARLLDWVAVGRCSADACQWDVFDSDDVPGLVVQAMAIGPDGTAYVAAEDGIILVYDGDGWTPHSAPNRHVESLAVTADGTLWAGTPSGGELYSFDGTEFTRHDLGELVPEVDEVTVSAARGTTVWVSTDTSRSGRHGIVASYDGNVWRVHDEGLGMWSDHAQLAVGPDSQVWAVHDDGAHGYSRYGGTAWKGFPSGQPVSGGGVVTPDGTLWTIVTDPDHTEALPEQWLVSFDGNSETVHDSPFTGAPQSGTLAVALDEVSGLDDHRVLALVWQPVHHLAGGAFWLRVDSDPFSARDVMHPVSWSDEPSPVDEEDGWGADDYLWDETATLRPGTYRVEVYAHPGELIPFGRLIPADPIDRRCFVDVDVHAGETTLVTISDIPAGDDPPPCPG